MIAAVWARDALRILVTCAVACCALPVAGRAQSVWGEFGAGAGLPTNAPGYYTMFDVYESASLGLPIGPTWGVELDQLASSSTRWGHADCLSGPNGRTKCPAPGFQISSVALSAMRRWQRPGEAPDVTVSVGLGAYSPAASTTSASSWVPGLRGGIDMAIITFGEASLTISGQLIVLPSVPGHPLVYVPVGINFRFPFANPGA